MEDKFNIARPYAKAVFALALASSSLEKWSKSLQTLSALAQDVKVAAFLQNPFTAVKERSELLTIDKLSENFIHVLAAARRLLLLPEIAFLYEKMRAAHEKIITAEVFSSVSLTLAQQKKLQQVLSKKFHYEVRLNYHIDESLLGGLLIRAGDFVFDGSVRSNLNRLRKVLRGS